MKGWFDAFRYDGGPTLYSFNNRTAVTGDVTVITFLAIFSTLYVAFLIIFPGIRKEKFTTFCAVTLSLFVGATILISIFGSAWHVANAHVNGTYRAFSKEKVLADIGVYVGLKHVNITLQASSNNWTTDIDFNERFLWLDSYQMGNSFKTALVRGLPFPILTVAEYFTLGQEGLAWGGQYRAAGYFAIIMLWTSFVVWILMNLMLIAVPRYGAVLMTTCGFLLLSTVCGYFGMLPESPLVIYLEGSILNFRFGWCYWLVLIAGGVCLLAGVIITTVEIIYPHSFSTILEVDYDTPYDRHIIIEDSRGKRFQKKRNSNNGSKLEEPATEGLGSRILRRLSSRNRDENSSPKSSKAGKQTFELEASAWRYPYKDNNEFSRQDNFNRSMSHGSVISNLSRDVPPVHKEEFSRYGRYSEKMNPVSMW
ncbi:dual oxidase maturation factor 1 isoform X2 [Anoplophora glabripennis]|nr:dual oxidase maturation factor 1 isoform X2 [Anoplophora glabripennis]XP_018563307.1 dual oxidase maturation factor 1 isoform X2 [Anoplophora glabripennis]XP_018563308.1 dual oxidase maturation factor 1 isoform X2 [Anoplophora glabripennis]XP_018563309.1 dual oxidase maturation factor 1 isoform X2 [Anoplophora glabripennis]